MFRNFDGHRERGIGTEQGVDWLLFIFWMLLLTLVFSFFFMAETDIDVLDVISDLF